MELITWPKWTYTMTVTLNFDKAVKINIHSRRQASSNTFGKIVCPHVEKVPGPVSLF